MKGKFAEYRATLEAKKEELSERLSQIEKDVRHIEKPLERDFEEQAVERQNDEVLDALDATTREEIEAINTAIMKIDSGDYGFCGQCGEEISEERLRIIPHVELCIDCAEEMEPRTS